MKFNPEVHRRRSIRLQDYDYFKAGAYFITICVQNQSCLFGKITGEKIILNDAGKMVQRVWDEFSVRYPGIKTDEFIVMPNHIHGIIVLTENPSTNPVCVGATPRGCPQNNLGQARGPAPTKMVDNFVNLSLSDVVHRFKTTTTKRYMDGVKQNKWAPFLGRLWQRNYWERIIRNESELNRIREYIATNPQRWENSEVGCL